MVQKDKTTKQYLNTWGPKDTPRGLITEGSLRPGFYPGFALLGFVQERENDWPVVLVHAALMKGKTLGGGMLLSMPFNPRTERAVCWLLENLGWDGRLWPYKDHGWPEGTPDEAHFAELLKKVDVGASFTFPADPEKGTPTLRMYVGKRNGAFHTAPFYGTPMPQHLEALRELVKDPIPFKSDWIKEEDKLSMGS